MLHSGSRRKREGVKTVNVMGRLRVGGPTVSLENNMENEKILRLLV